MFKRLFTKAALAGAMFMAAQAASAATYNILNVENLTSGGFRTSVFHEASSHGGKSGAILAESINGTASGTWNSVSGLISIVFDVLRTDNTIVTVTGAGTLNLGTTRANGLDGSIAFTFSDTIGGLLSSTVSFLDYDYGIGPNAFDPGLERISLWGAEGTPTTGGNFDTNTTTLGADLRITLTPVPLPGAGLLLLGALGGLGAIRRRRKVAA